MLFDLQELLDRPGNRDFEASQFEEAADRLLASQCLFRDDWHCRETYELIVRFKGYFTDLFEGIGRDLVINERELMVELRPRRSQARMTLKLDETILLLSLRAAFEQGVAEFSQDDYGAVGITSMELLERYEPITGRPRPSWARLKDILASFRRRHFIELGEEFPEESGVAITVRPSIRSVTGEGWLERIEAFLQSDQVADEETDAPQDKDVRERAGPDVDAEASSDEETAQ